MRNKAIARSKLVTYDARSPIIKTIYTWICCIIKTSFSCRNKRLWLAKVGFFSFSRSQSDLQMLKTSFNNIPVDVLLVGQTVEWVHCSAVNRNTWITTENAKFKIYLLREKCLNTELFLIHKVTIRKRKLLVYGSAVNRNTWITTENAKFKIYLQREKCLNTELFLIHKVTIKKLHFPAFKPEITPYLDTHFRLTLSLFCFGFKELLPSLMRLQKFNFSPNFSKLFTYSSMILNLMVTLQTQFTNSILPVGTIC